MGKEVHFEDVDVGFEIPQFVKGPVTKEKIKDYAEAAGDPNPMHYDEDFAKMAGFQTVIAHGLMTMAFVSEMLTNWLPSYTQLKRLKTRFTKVVYPGNILTCKGKVTQKYVKEDGNYVELDVWADNQDGETVAKGTATVVLPSRHKS
jgi:acyl dehydratase